MRPTIILRWSAGGLLALAMVALVSAGSVMAQQSITLDLSSYAFAPDPLVLEAGQTYQITLRNVASEEHELMAGRGTAAMDDHAGGHGMDHGYAENFFDGMHVVLIAGGAIAELGELEEIELEPGAEMILEFTVPEAKRGSWELGCFVPGHYDLGMHAALVVE